VLLPAHGTDLPHVVALLADEQAGELTLARGAGCGACRGTGEYSATVAAPFAASSATRLSPSQSNRLFTTPAESRRTSRPSGS
jgi:hypothetical protein